jgi:hypothetical protein
MKRLLKNLLSVFVIGALGIVSIGCGGGSGGGTATVTSPVIQSVSGTVIDGYVEGAIVCEDTNENNQCDNGEPTGRSDLNGNFTLQGIIGSHQLLSDGGVSMDTNLTVKGVMSAPAGSLVITPATTIIQSLVKSGLHQNEAEEMFKTAFNLDTAVTMDMIIKSDPIALVEKNTTGAADIVRSIVQIQNIIAQSAAAIHGVEQGISDRNATRSSLNALIHVMKTSTGRIDSDPTKMTRIVNLALENSGTSAPSSVSSNVGTIIATINKETEKLSVNQADILTTMPVIAIVGQETAVLIIIDSIANNKEVEVNLPQVVLDANATAILIAANKEADTLNASSRKPIYDATGYTHKNVENEKFFLPVKILYQHISLFQNKEYVIDVDYLRNAAKKLPVSSVPYILDVEIWDIHMSDDVEANANIDKYILIIDTMKKERPDLKFGYYGVLPNRDYWSPVSNDSKKIAEWNRINNRLQRLSEHVDVVCPSLYTFYNNPEGWKKYALENIKQAKKYGKPVYPFIWPQYHGGGNVQPTGTFIDASFWLMQLSLIYQESDGAVIWGGWNQNGETYEPMEWDETASWWQITKKFIAENQ